MNRSEEAALLGQVAEFAGLHFPEIVLPEDGQLVANGMRFHYLDWDGPSKKQMLLLHGGGLNAHTWDLVCSGLRNDYHCIAPDARGHGDSEWSPISDYGRDAHLRDAEAYVEHFGLDNFVLVGMSMGGAAAINYAGKHSDKLSHLIIIDMGPETQRPGTNRIRDFSSEPEGLDSLEEYLEKAVKFNPLRKPEVLRRSLGYNTRKGTDGKWYFKHDQRRRNTAEEPTDEEIAERQKVMWGDVAGITVPTLVVRGGKSDVFSDENAEKFASTLKDGRWVRVEGAGHTVQGDQPKALLKEMRKFLGLSPLPE